MSLKSLLVGALALTAFAAPTAAQAAEYGPDPTVDGIRQNGGYELDRISVPDAKTPGFGRAYLYAPKDTSVKWGAIAIAPGWTESTSAVHWLAPRLASHGFAVIVFDVNNTFFDLPSSRASQLLRALDYFRNQSAMSSRIDGRRTAVMGHSMGGGGALEATLRRKQLKAAIPLMPWDLYTNFGGTTVPTMIIGSDGDIIAPTNSHSIPFYNSIPATTPKAYMEMKNEDHFASNSPNVTIGAQSIAWMKRFVDDDTRYSQFICPEPTGAQAGKVNRYWETCPF